MGIGSKMFGVKGNEAMGIEEWGWFLILAADAVGGGPGKS